MLIVIFFVVPRNVVWGGQEFQTVPTLGPTRTPTRIPTMTRTLVATDSRSTQPAESVTAPTLSQSNPVLSTSTPDSKITATLSGAETLVPLKSTLESTVESLQSSPESASTSKVILPLVSSGEEMMESQSEENQNPEIPAFVFPLVVVLLLVIIYLITRLSLKNSVNNQNSKK